jgi:hypothetical protein
MGEREDAHEFLCGLREHLASKIDSARVSQWMEKIKSNRPTGKDVPYEGLFTDEFVLPHVSEYLCQRVGSAKASIALLAESSAAKQAGIAFHSPASCQKHLFTKEIGVSLDKIIEQWWAESKKLPVSQSCPDWAFRSPCPYTVVFEGKFFRNGSVAGAKAELVKSIYQCFYYRAQPRIDGIGTSPGWDYDYACLFAYDASKSGVLTEAWDAIPQMQDECWNAANIFVMVCR